MAEQAKVAVLTDPRKFEYREVDIPGIGPDEGILRVEAAGLCGTDWEQYLGHLDNTPWAVRPIIPGHEILGWIEKVGVNAAKKWDVKKGIASPSRHRSPAASVSSAKSADRCCVRMA